MSQIPVIYWGGTGQAKVLREFSAAAGYKLEAVFDNDPSLCPPFPDVPLYIGQDGLRQWLEGRQAATVHFVVAIGGYQGAARLEIHKSLRLAGLQPISVIHPTAYIASSATIAEGCQILARAVVGAEASISDCCILNTACSVDHECRLEAGVHVGPGALLTGCVHVGENTFIGAGAVVLPRVRLGADCIIGAGSVVTRDVPPSVVAFGSPAKVQRHNSLRRSGS